MVSYRRIRESRVAKWMAGIGVSGTSVLFLFAFLTAIGAITPVWNSGDTHCAGTVDDPCIAELIFTANTDIYIYPNQSWYFFTDKPMKELKLQRTWGDSWRTIDLTKTWNKNVKYAIKFNNGSTYHIRYWGLKENPTDTIKWSFGAFGDIAPWVDPYWYPSESAETRTFVEDWEGGSIDTDYWETFSSDLTYGRIRVTNSDGTPHGGSYHLVMDVNTDNHENRNAIITKIDFSGADYINLSFWNIEYGEEDDECPTSWTGYDPGASQGDCVAFTCDNNTWFKAVDLAPAVASYTFYSYNFSDDVNWCPVINDTFRIWFGQDDNYAYSTDGMGYDDINITFDPPGTDLYLDGQTTDTSYEIGTVANISCYMDPCCLSINASGYGDNFTCIYGGGQYNFTTFAEYFKTYWGNEFEEISSNGSWLFIGKEGDYVSYFSINVTGLENGGNCPKDVVIRPLGEDDEKVTLYGYINGSIANIDYTSNGNSSETINLTESGSILRYIQVPLNATNDIIEGKFNLTGETTKIYIDEENSSSWTSEKAVYYTSYFFDENYLSCAWTDQYNQNVTMYENMSYDVDAIIGTPVINWSMADGPWYSNIYCWNTSSDSWYTIRENWQSPFINVVYDVGTIPDDCDDNGFIQMKIIAVIGDVGTGAYPYCEGMLELDSIKTQDVEVDIGDDGNIDWNITGIFDEEVEIDNLTAFTDYFENECTSDPCLIPIRIGTSESMSVTLADINVSYTFNPIEFNVTETDSFLYSNYSKTEEVGGALYGADLLMDSSGGIRGLGVVVDGQNRDLYYFTTDLVGAYDLQLIDDNSDEADPRRNMEEYHFILGLNATEYPRVIYFQYDSYSGSSDDGYYYLEYNGTGWEEEKFADEDTGWDESDQGPSNNMIIDDNDDLHFVMFNGTGILFQTRDSGTDSWSYEIIDDEVETPTATDNDMPIDLAQNSSGTYFVVYSGTNSTDSDYDNVYLAYNTTAGNWESAIMYSGGSSTARSPKVAWSSATNNVSIVWATWTGGGWNVNYGEWDGTTFYYELAVLSTDSNVWSSLALDSEGNPHITARSSGGPIRHSYKRDGIWYTDLLPVSGQYGFYSEALVNTTYDEVFIGFQDYTDQTEHIYRFSYPEQKVFRIGAHANTWGALNLSDLRYEFNGTIHYNVTADSGATSEELNMSIYFSNYTLSLPANREYIEFIPTTPSSYNVTPFGQTPNIPIFNLTFDQYNDINASWYIYLYDDVPMVCINTTASNTSTKTDGENLTNSWIEFMDNKGPLYNWGIWLWADYDCDYSTWKMWEPTYYFRACCEGCICSEELT